MRTWTWRSAILCAGFLLGLLTPQILASPTSARVPVRSRVTSYRPLARTISAPSGILAAMPSAIPSATPAAAFAAFQPLHLLIAKLGLNAPILALGPDATGAMQAPRSGDPRDPVWGEVYRWDIGYVPGQVGIAVIAGHVNQPDASPATFTRLNWLVPGDRLQVVTTGGIVLTFVVSAKNTPLVTVRGGNDPTVEAIFGPSLSPNLNLMTCWGEWDGKEFDRRLVVYTTLVGPSPFPGGQSLGVPG